MKSLTSSRLFMEVKRPISTDFIIMRRMAFSSATQVKFPWEINNQTVAAIVGSESIVSKTQRQFFLFNDADRLSEEKFLDSTIASYKASSEAVFDYSQQVQRLIQQNPSSVKCLSTHALLEQGREKIISAVAYPLSDDLIKNIHNFYLANPSAEVIFKRDEEAGPPVKIETYPTLSVSILPVSSPTASILNSSVIKKNISFPANDDEEAKENKNFFRSSFPLEYKTYEPLLQNNDPGVTVALDVKTLVLIVRIQCVELFYIKDRLTNAILQGASESQLKTHIVSENLIEPSLQYNNFVLIGYPSIFQFERSDWRRKDR